MGNDGMNVTIEIDPEVACPEDDGEAMTTICYVTHHQASKIQESMDMPSLIRVAQLSD